MKREEQLIQLLANSPKGLTSRELRESFGLSSSRIHQIIRVIIVQRRCVPDWGCNVPCINIQPISAVREGNTFRYRLTPEYRAFLSGEIHETIAQKIEEITEQPLWMPNSFKSAKSLIVPDPKMVEEERREAEEAERKAEERRKARERRKAKRGCQIPRKYGVNMRKLTEAEKAVNHETWTHIHNVQTLMMEVVAELQERALLHDRSKLVDPEVQIFTEFTAKLKHMTYGSDEYKQCLKEMGPALEHHYADNPHHPEHHENRIEGMTLIDLMEMLCDWKAATMRHEDGDILESLEINAKRFSIDPQLARILLNTVLQVLGVT
jgi:hypothetical protein